jgi:PAS domain S-box-containing protein
MTHELLETSLLGEAIATSSVPIIVWDSTFRYLGANDAARALLGYTADELFALRPALPDCRPI